MANGTSRGERLSVMQFVGIVALLMPIFIGFALKAGQVPTVE